MGTFVCTSIVIKYCVRRLKRLSHYLKFKSITDSFIREKEREKERGGGGEMISLF